MKKLWIAVTLLGLLSVPTLAQQNRKYPMVGDTLPDHTFTDLINYRTKSAKLSDFRGKWLILDFWGYTCTACIKSFPKMNQLVLDFRDQVQLIMVGATKNGFGDTKKIEKITKDLYSRLQKRDQLKFTVAFDSVLYLKHDVGGLPQIFVIDPNGVLQAKVQHIDSTNVANILNGKFPDLSKVRSFSRSEPNGREAFDRKLPMLTTGKNANGGVDTAYLYRSMLTVPSNTMPHGSVVDFFRESEQVDLPEGKLELYNNTLEQLYCAAYLGRSVWEVADTLNYYNKISRPIIQGLDLPQSVKLLSAKYSYSLNIPKEKVSPEHLMQIMQRDLETYFGYRGTVEQKEMPVYFIKIIDQQKFKKSISVKKGMVRSTFVNYGEQKFENFPIEEFLFQMKISCGIKDYPIITENLGDLKVNVKFKANMIDPIEVIEELNRIGVGLVKGTKVMQVIVLDK